MTLNRGVGAALLGLAIACGSPADGNGPDGTGGVIDDGVGDDALDTGGSSSAGTGGAHSPTGGDGSGGTATGGDGTGGNTLGCMEGATRCSESVMETCSPTGEWVSQACDHGCSGDACGTECSPGETQCVGSDLQSCTQQGVWQTILTGVECPCIEGQTRCEPSGSNTTYHQTCNQEGAWVTQATCLYGCASLGCYGECNEGQDVCGDDGRTPWQCIDHEYVEQPQCSFVCNVAGECGGECVPDEVNCVAEPPYSWRLMSCDEGYYGNTVETCGYCETDTCLDCKPGWEQCTAEGILQLCDANGDWQDEEDCDFVCRRVGPITSRDYECAGECVPESVECNESGEPRACRDNGFWSAYGTCNYGCSGSLGCNCEAPPGRLTVEPDGDVYDSTTGLTWRGTWTTSCGMVTPNGSLRNASLDEILSLLVHQDGEVTCTENTDDALAYYRGRTLRFASTGTFTNGGAIEVDTLVVHEPAPLTPLPPNVYACIVVSP